MSAALLVGLVALAAGGATCGTSPAPVKAEAVALKPVLGAGDVVSIRPKSRELLVVKGGLADLALTRPEWLGFDEAKGEALVVITTREMDLAEMRARLSAAGLPNLWIPKKLQRVEAIPALGSGKLDLKSCRELAMRVGG